SPPWRPSKAGTQRVPRPNQQQHLPARRTPELHARYRGSFTWGARQAPPELPPVARSGYYLAGAGSGPAASAAGCIQGGVIGLPGRSVLLLGQVSDHRLRVRLPVEADRTLTQLVGVLPWCCYRDSLHGRADMIVDLRATGGSAPLTLLRQHAHLI